jgi:hypothetical protein
MTGPLFSHAAFAALNAFRGADRQFWPDLLKDSFNCHGLAQAWYPHRNDPGERTENVSVPVALWGPRRYISGSKFP